VKCLSNKSSVVVVAAAAVGSVSVVLVVLRKLIKFSIGFIK
jgi:hypothetical protein